MQLTLHGATILNSALVNDIKVARAVGFDALEIWMPKLEHALQGGSLAFVKKLLAGDRKSQERPVAAAALELTEGFTFRTFRERRDFSALMYSAAASANTLESPWVIVRSRDRPEDVDDEALIVELAERLVAMSKIAREFGDVGVALRVDRTVGDLALAAEALRRAREEAPGRLGLLMDTLELAVMGIEPSALSALAATDIAGVHVADIPADAGPMASAEEGVLPGEGTAPVRDYVAALTDTGWSGMVSVRVLNPLYHARPPEVVAAQALEALQRIVA